MSMTEERLSLRDAADALGISEVTARRWVKSGKLKAYQPGRKYLIPASAVEELLSEDDAPKVLLPFDVLEVIAQVIRDKDPQTPKEFSDVLDAEYVRRLEGWPLEELLAAEDALMPEYRELVSAIPTLGATSVEDQAKYQRWVRVRDELRAVMVARVEKGVPKRYE